MKILLFCDDHYHPGDVPIKGLEPLKAKGYNIDVISDSSNFDIATLANYKVIIMSKCDHISMENHESWKTPAFQQAMVNFVENGGGLLVTHSGTVAGTDRDAKGNSTAVLDKLIGCRFASHPNNSPITVSPLKPHPITESVGIFTEVDEHYHIEILADDIDILAAGYGGPQGDPVKYETEPYMNYPEYIAPSAYVRTQGKGKVCVLTPGHHLEVWLNPEYQKMLVNAVKWCGSV